ncbi:VOC family protein [Actinocorallia sp. A-T 12471]|uniref:VOC family protein n=1 Tax=Actinocorallia sp. A-T 12471 TaxID=3089813 RepID=UPI0029D05C71|nr:VOC family protein [Actinocorallia sp. A-T 12471]MDX6740040.1 VOC family protein [Actinocorallia sp. A-T 12471]
MAKPRLAHIVLQTSRPQEMAEWYCTLLEGHVVYAGHGLTFLTFDEEHHRIAFIAPPEALREKDKGAAGLHHTAFTFADLDDLLARHRALAEVGIEPVVPVQHGVTTSLYYRDPDGNHVEMQVDNFAVPDDATAYMNGPEYDGDPVGPAFDVERMAAERAEGRSVEELQSRAWALTCPDQPDPLAALTA